MPSEGADNLFFLKIFFVFCFFCYIATGLSINTLTTNKNNRKMKELLEKINAEVQAFGKDAALQLNKGNKAAGARARKAALALMKDLKEFRKVSVDAAK